MRATIIPVLVSCLLVSACGASPLPAAPLPEAVATQPGVQPEAPPPPAGEITLPPPAAEGPAPADISIPGLRCAYLKSGDVWLWSDGAAARQLTAGGGVSALQPSPDGARVAFERGGELWVVDVDGAGEGVLVPRAYLEARGAAQGAPVILQAFGWFPGRQALYFSTARDAGGYTLPNQDLHLVEPGSAGPAPWMEPGAGGRPAFAPDGNLLAVASREWIDVLDLAAGTRTRPLSFPALANFDTGYLPQVVWMPDSSGFKTVVPPSAAGGANPGPAEFLFIFPGGAVGRLASFELLPLDRAQPLLSPDGAYLLYAAESAPGDAALYLMDSSGAARAYSQPAAGVSILGWAPDSKRFAYALGTERAAYLGAVDGAPQALPPPAVSALAWLEGASFLALQDGSLWYYESPGAAGVALDSAVTQFALLP